MHMQKGPQKINQSKGTKLDQLHLIWKYFFFISTLFYNSVTLFNYWYLVKIPVIGAALTRSSPPRAVSGRSKAWGIFPPSLRVSMLLVWWRGRWTLLGGMHFTHCVDRSVFRAARCVSGPPLPFLLLPLNTNRIYLSLRNVSFITITPSRSTLFAFMPTLKIEYGKH